MNSLSLSQDSNESVDDDNLSSFSKKYECQLCKKQYKYKRSYDRHTKGTHKDTHAFRMVRLRGALSPVVFVCVCGALSPVVFVCVCGALSPVVFVCVCGALSPVVFVCVRGAFIYKSDL
jgi:hypothetical protein